MFALKRQSFITLFLYSLRRFFFSLSFSLCSHPPNRRNPEKSHYCLANKQNEHRHRGYLVQSKQLFIFSRGPLVLSFFSPSFFPTVSAPLLTGPLAPVAPRLSRFLRLDWTGLDWTPAQPGLTDARARNPGQKKKKKKESVIKASLLH